MHEPAINAAYTKERHTLRACERPWAPCTLQNRQKYGMSVRHSHEERMAGVCVYPVFAGFVCRSYQRLHKPSMAMQLFATLLH